MNNLSVYPVSKEQIKAWIATIAPSRLMNLLFGNGILENSMDASLGLYLNGKLIGVALLSTIVQTGQTSMPTIYILPEYRSQGNGTFLFKETINLCRVMNRTPVFVDVMSTKLRSIVQKYPFQEYLEIKRSSPIFDTYSD